MEGKIRRIVEMAERALQFAEAHPSADTAHGELVQRLAERLARARALDEARAAGWVVRQGAAMRRLEVHEAMHAGLLRNLVRAGELAAEEDPAVAGVFALPKFRHPYQAYVTAVRRMLAAIERHGALLRRHGMLEAVPAQLAAALAEFEATQRQSVEGRHAHVGARAGLKAVADDLRRLVLALDGVYRVQLRGDVNAMQAWVSARDVMGAPRRRGVEEEAEGEVGETAA